MKKISIIVPCKNEINFLEEFISSVTAQNYPKEYSEIIIVDGMSNDGSYEYLTGLDIENLIVLQNPHQYVSQSLNIGIRNSKGSLIIRMDVHSIFPIDYVSTLVDYHNKNPHIGNVGVPCKTISPENNMISNSIAAAISSPLGVGTSNFRINVPKKFQLVDTVPFGCWSKKIFDKVGYFDEELIRNQDDEFNQRIIKHGFEIHLLSGPIINYFSRKDLRSHAKMFYQYGLFKPLVNKKIKKITTIRQLAPVFLVIWLFILILISPFNSYISLNMFLFVLFGYAGSSFCYLLFKKYNILMFFYFVVTIFITHISYGSGYIKSLFVDPRSNEISSSR